MVKPQRRVFNTDRITAGNQYVILGTERIPTSADLARLAEKPMMSHRRKVGLHATALFGARAG